MALPLLCYLATFLCNDVSGCPVPSLLHPSTITWKTLKEEVGWPKDGLSGFLNWTVMSWVLGYYALLVVMQLGLPGEERDGVELRSGGRLKYKFNSASPQPFRAAGSILTALFFPSPQRSTRPWSS